jgi:hypothetical protein
MDEDKKFTAAELKEFGENAVKITAKGIVSLARELSGLAAGMSGPEACGKLAEAVENAFLKDKP